MAQKFLGFVNFLNRNGNPATGVGGDAFFDSSVKKLKIHDGTSWTEVGGGGGGSPLLVPAGSTAVIPANFQAPYKVSPRVEGVLQIDGLLVEV